MFPFDWNKFNIFAFFPPVFSIYLSFISGLSKSYLCTQVQRAVARNVLVGHEDFVRNMAWGWATKLSFINAMIASFFSVISVWSTSKSFVGVVLTFVPLLLMLPPIMWYLFRYEPDQIVSDRSGNIPYTPAFMCKVILLSVNIILIIAIAITQQLSP
jgi:hypothetical protein